MRLRAISMAGDYVFFEMRDCPVILNDRAFILLNRPNSPILQLGSIARGTDDERMYEGDFVLDGQYNVIGYVIYNKGFKVFTLDENVIPMQEDFKVLSNSTVLTSKIMKSSKSPMVFVSDDISFTMYSLVTCEKDVGYVFSKNLKSINLDQVKFATGYRMNGKDICFGDELKGGLVVLHDCLPAIKTDDGFQRLMEGEYE